MRSHLRILTRPISSALLVSVSVCALSTYGYAQSLDNRFLIRGTSNAAGVDTNNSDDINNPVDNALTGTTTNTTTGAVRRPVRPARRPEQPVKLNPRQRPLPAISSVHTNDTLLADSEELRTGRENARVAADQPRTVDSEITDPFAPLGFRMGSSIANLTLEQTIGYSSNISQAPEPIEGYFSQTNFSFDLQSDWSRHQLTLGADASYRKFLQDEETARPTADLRASLRLDLVDGYASTLGATYNFATESLTSNNLGANVTARPGVHTLGASAELARNDRKLNFLLRGVVTSTSYDTATVTGGTLDQSDRDNTRYALIARAEYDNGAAIKLFMQEGAAASRYDLEVDRNGDSRDAGIYEIRTGIGFDFGEKLTGEIAAGYILEDYDAGGLENLAGYTLNGTLNWSPSRETTVVLNAATTLNGSTTAGNNGSIVYNGGLAITRKTTDRLSLNLNATFNFDYDEQSATTDTTYTLGTGAQYWVNRYMAISANLGHTIFIGSSGTNDYDETTATLGVVLQR
ncbi:MAG: outer membrane beta-barrel protein [Rhizobiaceae bacterium]|nr:outer membrane beta-barrel protein [Rhizobiaceae bacterium]